MSDPFHTLDSILISKISLNGALSSSHIFTFSLNKVFIVHFVFAGTKPHCKHKKLKEFYCIWSMFFFPKYFLNGFFMVEEGSGERKLFI